MEKLFGGAVVWQFPAASETQMMGYAVECEDKLILIDGGTASEAPFLKEFLKSRKKVDGWFITHAHADHIDCVTEILKTDYPVDFVAFNFEGAQEIFEKEFKIQPSLAAKTASAKLIDALNKRKSVKRVLPKRGEIFDFGKIKVKALNDPSLLTRQLKEKEFSKEPVNQSETVNNLSAVYKIFTPGKSILFLGDLSSYAGKILLEECEEDFSDVAAVQMAHHGQRGVDLEFYSKLSPSVCLWPAPEWLYDNLGEKGFDSGPFLTVRTREYMQSLGVKRHYSEKDGLVKLL